MDIKAVLKTVTQDYKTELDDVKLMQFEKYFNLLVEWNQKINLTAITDVNGVAIKHFADSLTLFNYIDVPEGASIIDVGTGAGFPGVVLKIARPDIKLTLLDSLNKRLSFLSVVLQSLDLEADLVHSRAEQGARNPKYREKYDFSVSRAVARLNVLGEYCLPYVKTGGKFVALKGPDAEDEIISAKSAIAQLGGKVGSISKFDLPNNEGNRVIIAVDKIKNTPKQFPRTSQKIKSNPL